MNDYARVRSKNEKKKQEKIVSLFFLISHYSPLTFDGRLTSWGRKQETETRRSKRKKKKEKKKKEKREKNRSAFDFSDRFKQHEAGIKKETRASKGRQRAQKPKEETEKRS